MTFLERRAAKEFRAAPPINSQVSSYGYGSFRYLSPGLASTPNWDAYSAIERAYYSNIYVYAAINRIAKDAASLPIRAGRNVETPKKYQTSAPLARLLGPPPYGPNSVYSGRDLIELAFKQYLLTGRFVWWLNWVDGEVAEIWPLQTDLVTPIRSTSPGQYWSGFEYLKPGMPGHQIYRPEEIVYVWNPAQDDFSQPESPLRAARLNVAVANSIDTFEHSFYKNNAVPAYLISTQGFAEDGQRTVFQEQFKSEFGGPQNAGKTMFLETGYDSEYGDAAPSAKDSFAVEKLGTNAEDAQTMDARNSHIQDICVAFGVPLSVIGDTTRAKFQNADMDSRNYWCNTMKSHLEDFAGKLNAQLAPRLGPQFCWFDTSQVRQMSLEVDIPAADAAGLITANIIDRDEWRAQKGLGPAVDAGLADFVAPTAGTPSAPADPPEADIPAETPPNLRAVELRHAGGDHLHIPSGHLTPTASKADTIKAWQQIVTDALANALGEQRSHVERSLTGRKSKSADDLLPDYWATRLQVVMDPLTRALALAGVEANPLSPADFVQEIRTALEGALKADELDLDSVYGGRAERAAESILGPTELIPFNRAQQVLLDAFSGRLDRDSALSALEDAA